MVLPAPQPEPPRLPITFDDGPARVGMSLQPQPVVLRTPSGATIASAVATFDGSPHRWRARVTNLNQPGVVARLFFAEGLRDIVVALRDGRSARARIIGTTFVAGAQRVLDVTGSEPLA